MFRNASGKILVRFWHFPIMTLGPGKRLGIWLQGCSIHCKGCIAPENQPFDENFSVEIDSLIDEMKPALKEASGITISGGEPLDQKESLLYLLERLNNLGTRDILLYSGYTKNEIISKCPQIMNLIAALIDGAFIMGALTNSIWKGSENQTLNFFRSEFYTKYENWINASEETGRKLQLVKKGIDYYLIGIPEQTSNLKGV